MYVFQTEMKDLKPKKLDFMWSFYFWFVAVLSAYSGLPLLNQYSPVPRARSSTAGKDARAQIYAGLGRFVRFVHFVPKFNPGTKSL